MKVPVIEFPQNTRTVQNARSDKERRERSMCWRERETEREER